MTARVLLPLITYIANNQFKTSDILTRRIKREHIFLVQLSRRLILTGLMSLLTAPTAPLDVPCEIELALWERDCSYVRDLGSNLGAIISDCWGAECRLLGLAPPRAYMVQDTHQLSIGFMVRHRDGKTKKTVDLFSACEFDTVGPLSCTVACA